MYLINFPVLKNLEQFFIAVERYRSGQVLVGVKDGINTIYRVPNLEKFVHNLPYLSISLYYNGQRLSYLDDYTVQESGGSGTGFDTVTLLVALRVRDKLIADYILDPP